MGVAEGVLVILIGMGLLALLLDHQKVDRVAAYHDLPPAEVSALFGHRGLFRA